MACLIVTVQAAGWVYHSLGGQPGLLNLAGPGEGRWLGAATGYFLFNTLTVRRRSRCRFGSRCSRSGTRTSSESAPSYFVGAASGRGDGRDLNLSTQWWVAALPP
jgi:hypothetical protein